MVNPKTKNTLEEKWLGSVIGLALPGKSMVLVLAETLWKISKHYSQRLLAAILS